MDYAALLRYFARVYVDADALVLSDEQVADLPSRLGLTRHRALRVVEQTVRGPRDRVIVIPNGPAGLNVALLSDSIDLMLMSDGAPSSEQEFTNFANGAASILGACSGYVGRTPYRVALVREGLLSEVPLERLAEIADRLLLRPDGEPRPFEWDWRSATHGTIAVGSRDEQINRITSVKRLSGKILDAPFDRIRVDIDVNTSHQNSLGRFDMAGLADFFARALDVQTRLSVAILDHMGVTA